MTTPATKERLLQTLTAPDTGKKEERLQIVKDGKTQERAGKI